MNQIDLTLELDEHRWSAAVQQGTIAACGHLGTHLDTMEKEFPLDYLSLPGVIFDVSHLRQGDVKVEDIDQNSVRQGSCVLFFTDSIGRFQYGTEEYARQHTQLSPDVVELLVVRRVKMIGLDAAGIRRGVEHKPMDQYCADNGVFVVENLVNLGSLLMATRGRPFIVRTFPLKLKGATGLPCRVVAEIGESD
ncbi:MAG TPA: cyclase family protein [Bacteroidota bacterium]|nr:cyclase family protein [Bacteroidota bacterium]